MAFLFSRRGNLLEKNPVQKGAVEFKNHSKNPRELRVFIAPAADKKIDSVTTIAGLEKFKPYEAVLNAEPRGELSALIVPEYLSSLWHLRHCRIRGRVIKNFNMGDMSQDRGICNARVHICEVDRIWWSIRKIPDSVILKIPEIIVDR